MTSASLRGATIRSADFPSSCSFRIGLYQKKSRERRRTTLDSVMTGMSPRSAIRLSSAFNWTSLTWRLRLRECRGNHVRLDDEAKALLNVIKGRGHAIILGSRGGAVFQQQAVIATEIRVLQRAQHALVGIDAGEQQGGHC